VPQNHPEHLNTPRLVADATGTTVWRWDQAEPFGNNPADEDPDANSIAFDLPLRLPGQRYDAESGHHYNYFRDYDPSLGIYKQSDLIGLIGGLNTYAYGSADPLRRIDPYGLRTSGLGGIARKFYEIMIKPREATEAGAGVEGSGIPSAGDMARQGEAYGLKLCKGPSRNFVIECGDFCSSLVSPGATTGAGGDVSECVKYCQDAYRRCKYPPSSSCPVPSAT